MAIPKKNLLPIDELNSFAESLRLSAYIDDNGKWRYRKDREDIIDEMLDLLLLAYARGELSAKDDIEGIAKNKPTSDRNRIFATIEAIEKKSGGKEHTEKMESSINKTIAGKTWQERVEEHLGAGASPEEIIRVADTETVRDFNEGGYDYAGESGLKLKKKWVAILDERTRDTHFELDGVVVGLNDRFVSSSGDSALHPGGFETAAENCNCRCGIKYIEG